MNVTGIIVEYNPLHNGHIYHINKTKEITKCDALIAVMSGSFVQRGEPAFVDKWSRTKMALYAGVDLVIELPVIYSKSSAEGFAFGAIATLDSTKIVNNVCFGSECGDISLLYKIAEVLAYEPYEYKQYLKDYLKLGMSFPSARLKSLNNYIIYHNLLNVNDINVENILKNSNNILGIEYIKSILKLKSNLKPFTIKRIVNKYNQEDLTGNISSATSIRKNINNEEVLNSMPEFCYKIIKEEIQNNNAPISLKSFEDIIYYLIRTKSPNELKNIIDVSEGLEFKLKQAAEDTYDIFKLIEYVKSKRYTQTRIQRILINILLNHTNDILYKVNRRPEYIRILGFNNKGRELIKMMKKQSSIPIITNPKRDDYEKLKLDIDASDIYALALKGNKKLSKGDLKTSPVYWQL
ncbi:MAG: nucleotidyltransferase [Caloramator sp.]|jgi:predicted nucleotidyltransferase|uniref:nucleotidyltransferase n=1 Tax=Caloramator sp. TaxID=1871330 RepID=UPI001DE44520|nr:nucleotidyltransferase [Caloramator sp.]MBZ4663803.1 nucleotidyltransferase [Caloramator sp.]